MDPTKNPVPLLKIKTLCAAWPFGHTHTLRLAREGKFKCIKIGRRYFADLKCIEQFLDEHRMVQP